MLGVNCGASCTPGYTIENAVNWTCDSCDNSCLTCQGIITNCTSCHAHTYLYNNSCSSTCPSPLVPDDPTLSCVSCDSSCKVCDFIKNNCSACDTNSSFPFLIFSVSTSSGTCNSSCPSLYYGHLVDGLCKLCSTLGIGCADCASQTTCNSCDAGLVLYLSACLSGAPPGFYDNNGVASQCDLNCATCEGTATNCTSCNGTLGLDGNFCTSTCPPGQVIVSNKCLNCTSPCLNCSGTQTFCSACQLIASPNTVYLTGGSCVLGALCPTYTYPEPNTLRCDPCTTASHCETCTTSQNCLTCVNGYFFSSVLNNTCVDALSCTFGTIPLSRVCVPCDLNCSTCQGTTSFCTTCINGTYLYS